jgi:Phosphopantetheine attachment site
MNSFRPPGDTEWNYLRLHYPLANHVLMDEISPGVFECVALDGLPSKGPSNSDDPPNSFRTRDLFTRHPDPAKSNYWKYLSRLDDRITLVNGEKVLPLPIEGRIRRDALIREAAVFGVGKSIPGVIIFKDEQAATMSDKDFLKEIRPSLDAANAEAESFSRIPDELVVLMSANTTYPKTDKGTIIRAQLYQQFASVIEAAYGKFENTAETGGLQLDTPELEKFLLDAFANKLGVRLDSVESDIFAAGVDSLQTTRLHGIVKKELDLGPGKDRLSQNVVFEKGNVRALAKHLHSLRTGEPEEDSDEISQMQEMIAKYSRFEVVDRTGLPDPSANVVVSTLHNTV